MFCQRGFAQVRSLHVKLSLLFFSLVSACSRPDLRDLRAGLIPDGRRSLTTGHDGFTSSALTQLTCKMRSWLGTHHLSVFRPNLGWQLRLAAEEGF
ncbi:hypothetical protein B0T10DRAFT_480404 [Thelonectria olida]|uniref:Secreted protein n=1 Tax=Thelonectria olida TaxID=1576542 RepID=A0A9P8W904_9HYPO|nr:hypothetical protein B0T10DRAFT_480404 [Thelonectria olida]